jgi:leucyl aminopeptidase
MMNIAYKAWSAFKGEDVLVFFAFQDENPRILGLDKDPKAKQGLLNIAKADGFKAKGQETLSIRPADQRPAQRVILAGLGKRNDFTNEVLRKAAGSAFKAADRFHLEHFSTRLPEIAKGKADMNAEIQALAEGLMLGQYRYDKYRKVPEDSVSKLTRVTFYGTVDTAIAQKAVERARIFSQAVILARDLVNEPPSVMNPERLEQEALKLNRKPVSVRVFDRQALEELGMGGILGVGAGSSVSPRLIELHYKPSAKPKKRIALVGKGITFDSGGLSLKPPQHMETMKTDMAGSATVLGVFSALAALKIPAEVYGYMAVAENMPGGRATKPGDILRTHKGKTIEVLNTDAEGRIVLADALAYAASKEPNQIIDVATLTGACVVALGSSVTGVLGNTPRLVQGILAAGEKSGEKFWEMPLVKEYEQDIRSKIADVKNIGSRRGEAGTIIGALFLKEFVDNKPWVHLDIAGPAWIDSDQPYCPAGATGHPVRTLLHYLDLQR